MEKILNQLLKILKNPVAWPVLVISAVTLGSRGLGFIRQFLIWDRLAKLDSDLLLSANKIPEFISIFLLMGTVYSSVLPIASKFENVDEKKLSKYLNLVILSLLGVVLVFTLLVLVFTEPILKLFTSSNLWAEILTEGLLEKYIAATRILLLVPISFALQGVLGVFLTLKKRFFVYSLAGVLTNIGTILSLLITKGDFVIVAWGIALGSTLSTAAFIWESLRSGLQLDIIEDFKNFKTDFQLFKKDLVQTWKLFLPRIFIIDAFYAASFIINPIAQNVGQITAFDIAISIQTIFFVIITSLGTVFFPDLSKTLHNESLPKATFWIMMKKYLIISAAIGTAITLITIVATPLVILLFKFIGKGQGNGDYIIMIAQVGAASVLFRSIREILAKYFYVKERLWQPVILSTFALLIQVFGILLLVFSFGWDAALACSVGLILGNLAWVGLGMFYLLKDVKGVRRVES